MKMKTNVKEERQIFKTGDYKIIKRLGQLHIRESL